MLKLQLRKHDAPSYRTTVVEFPAVEPDLQKEMEKIGVGITTEKLCLVDSVQGDNGSLQALAGTLVNADEVQYLAKRMDSFDKNELHTFYAVAEHEKLSEVKDLINLTFNLHCYALISEFSDVSAIGRRYELCRQTALSLNELESTTYASIGRRLIGHYKGAVTSYGVLYPTGNTPEQAYNGEQFPEYHWRDDAVATVTLEYGESHSNAKHEYLYFPCWEIEIEKAVNRLGAYTPCDCRTDLSFEGMSGELYQLFTEEHPLSAHLHTLNSLARCYTGFDEQTRNAFHAVLEMIQPKTPKEAVLIADNFYEFTVVPGIKTPMEYGRYMIIDSGRYEFDANLEEYIDFKRYGEHRIQIENGSFTEYGYIAYWGCTPAVEELLRQEDSQSMGIGGMQL
ncbi:hypothetical protein Dhaf_2418 [Desulfitobacterium hafniense DCB-2]|uniref:Antirestriction protein (ArdA) n=1 Tax=Desulfitobacterium hafniense (strain DSM 10664 / DCB-2) TaxID=272564 RepID=B8FU32_DESHD|nr:antirestriction protein ArdA [Desulfitobacterium hafniense]ACL20446.1 hypothetical protein Dhaf_2418 [Desulfitobacterium hafniense DCB-2]